MKSSSEEAPQFVQPCRTQLAPFKALFESCFSLQEATKMMRTTAMNSVQIMKEIKDGSKKESIKTVYSFHVR